MIGLYDVIYAIAAAALAPLWLIRRKGREKVASALRDRMGHVEPRQGDGPAILIHAVSLGEMNATRALVAKLREARPDLQIIISTTTNTGYDRGVALYAKAANTTLIRYPLDLTPAVARVLDRLRPLVVVLLELEVWPNFVKQCQRRGIPVLVINARLTTSSFRNYRIGRWLVRGTFDRLALVCAQDQTYADRFIAVGTPRQRVQITGTMKFDNALIAERVAGADELAQSVGLRAGDEPIWVCGSTGPGEEAIVLRVYRVLLERFGSLRLVIVPRHPERFNEVADLIDGAGLTCLRRSNPTANALPQKKGAGTICAPVVLGDTMGELRKFFSLADVIFIGRSMVDLGPRQHGSDMIEPAALAKPVVIGPFTNNFADAMHRFREANALIEVSDEQQLGAAVERLLENREEASEMGRRAAEVVRQNQGATDRHVRVILDALERSSPQPATSAAVVGGL